MIVQKVRAICVRTFDWVKAKLGFVPKDYYYKQRAPILKKDDNLSAGNMKDLSKAVKNALFAIENIIEVDDSQPQLRVQTVILCRAILGMIAQDSESCDLEGVAQQVSELTKRSKVFLDTFKQEFKSDKNMPESFQNRVNVRWIANQMFESRLT